MGNSWQIIWYRYSCEKCKKSAIIGQHPTFGMKYADICPFCQSLLTITPLSDEERKIHLAQIRKDPPAAGIATYDLAKLLK